MFIKASLALVATAGAVLTVHVVRGRASVQPTDRPAFVLAAGDHAAIPVTGAATITPDTQLAVARTAPPPPVRAAASEPVPAEVGDDECPAIGGDLPDGACDCAGGKCDGARGKAPDQPSHVALELDGAPAMGPRDAKVTIVELVDFQCPFCEKAVATVHDLAALYPDDVRVVIKHLPLPGHKQARPAAIAAMAADRQGKFWEMHEMLFSNQDRLDRASMIGYAKHLGLDVARFEADLADPAIAEAIDADASEAMAKGFRGVPAFAVNGRVVIGALPLDDMRAVVEEELAKVRATR